MTLQASSLAEFAGHAGVAPGYIMVGASSKFGAPMFEFKVFREQMYCNESSTCGIVGVLAWDIVHSLAPIGMPLSQ